MAEFLLEIGLEEVPARMLARAQTELGERVLELLRRERLLAADGAVQTFSTPRRLAVIVQAVEAKQPDAEEQLTGPAWAIAFKDNLPTPAAHAFAKKAGIDVHRLQPLATAKGEYASAIVSRPGRKATELLLEQLPREIAALGWPKPMYWRAGKPERFVRPVQWIVALQDEAVVPIEFAGVRAGSQSRGHRVLHGAEPVFITAPSHYREDLLAAKVMVDVEARRQVVRKALDRVTRTVAGARWREDEALVDTVTHLTEWPSVVLGGFDPAYLSLPEEVLVTVMRDHQKYFAVEDASGKLLPHFLCVLNTETSEQGEATIRHGNERVLRARFSDARFFWDFDQKTPMSDRVELLKSVLFHKDVGSYFDKAERTRLIANQLDGIARPNATAQQRKELDRAITLSKVDLTTELVKEFTELQGIVGALYVRFQRLEEGLNQQAVADAIYWQYMPASMSDPIPPTTEGRVLSLADRIGTIVDLFAAGLAPTGSKDPYALRRAANSVIKILALSKLPFSLSGLLRTATRDAGLTATVGLFLRERLSFYLREYCGLPADLVNAVLAVDADFIPDVQARGEAVREVRGSEDFIAISAAWKRSKNILKQAKEKGIEPFKSFELPLLKEEAEREFGAKLTELIPTVRKLCAEYNYVAALQAIATLRPSVDRFFEETMVMVEDPDLRGNRLALLKVALEQLGQIADFSELTSLLQESPA